MWFLTLSTKQCRVRTRFSIGMWRPTPARGHISTEWWMHHPVVCHQNGTLPRALPRQGFQQIQMPLSKLPFQMRSALMQAQHNYCVQLQTNVPHNLRMYHGSNLWNIWVEHLFQASGPHQCSADWIMWTRLGDATSKSYLYTSAELTYYANFQPPNKNKWQCFFRGNWNFKVGTLWCTRTPHTQMQYTHIHTHTHTHTRMTDNNGWWTDYHKLQSIQLAVESIQVYQSGLPVACIPASFPMEKEFATKISLAFAPCSSQVIHHVL